jgi:hypothetical protein
LFEKKAYNDVTSPNIIRKFCIKNVGRIQASIVSNSLQKWLVDIVGWETEFGSMVAKPNGKNGIFTVCGIVEEEALVRHVIINHRPESGVEGCPLIDRRRRVLCDKRHKICIIKVNTVIPKDIGPVCRCRVGRVCGVCRTIAQDAINSGIKSRVDSVENIG